MRQDLFNTVVLMIAYTQKVDVGDDAEKYRAMDEGLRSYRDFYVDDDFEIEAHQCVERVLNWINITASLMPTHMADLPQGDELQASWLRGLLDASYRYEPSGRKKSRRLLNGLRFTSDRKRAPNRPEQCLKDLELYHLHLMNGDIPA